MAGEKAQRQTWQDWVPPDRYDPAPLLTRSQLVATLRALGVDVEESDLRYWEYAGILPRAVRQRHAGATRAVYPSWYVALVRALRAWQGGGYELREIGEFLQVLFVHEGGGASPDILNAPMHAHHLAAALSGQSLGLAIPPPELVAALTELAERTRHIYGPDSVRRGEIRFYGDGPEPIIYGIDITITDDPEGGVSESYTIP